FGASDNVMPPKVVDALGLTLTKTIGRCHSMERQVPLVGQIKDAQAVLASFPDKRLKTDYPCSRYPSILWHAVEQEIL
ncbi:hypothetical protein KI387_019744, partial [Taxus chinensis]